MKTGDKVRMSDRNKNHLGYGVCAYSGMQGVVEKVWEDGSFSLNCGNSTLAVPMLSRSTNRTEGIWIWLNEELIFYNPINLNAVKEKGLLHRIIKMFE